MFAPWYNRSSSTVRSRTGLRYCEGHDRSERTSTTNCTTSGPLLGNLEILMLPAGRFRLRVIAELGESNSSVYALGLQCSSITGALYSLAESLAMRTDDGTIRGEELAAELVQMLCP